MNLGVRMLHSHGLVRNRGRGGSALRNMVLGGSNGSQRQPESPPDSVFKVENIPEIIQNPSPQKVGRIVVSLMSDPSTFGRRLFEELAKNIETTYLLVDEVLSVLGEAKDYAITFLQNLPELSPDCPVPMLNTLFLVLNYLNFTLYDDKYLIPKQLLEMNTWQEDLAAKEKEIDIWRDPPENVSDESCQRGDTSLLMFFCNNCGVSLCLSCLLKSHSTHKWTFQGRQSNRCSSYLQTKNTDLSRFDSLQDNGSPGFNFGRNILKDLLQESQNMPVLLNDQDLMFLRLRTLQASVRGEEDNLSFLSNSSLMASDATWEAQEIAFEEDENSDYESDAESSTSSAQIDSLVLSNLMKKLFLTFLDINIVQNNEIPHRLSSPFSIEHVKRKKPLMENPGFSWTSYSSTTIFNLPNPDQYIKVFLFDKDPSIVVAIAPNSICTFRADTGETLSETLLDTSALDAAASPHSPSVIALFRLDQITIINVDHEGRVEVTGEIRLQDEPSNATLHWLEDYPMSLGIITPGAIYVYNVTQDLLCPEALIISQPIPINDGAFVSFENNVYVVYLLNNGTIYYDKLKIGEGAGPQTPQNQISTSLQWKNVTLSFCKQHSLLFVHTRGKGTTVYSMKEAPAPPEPLFAFSFKSQQLKFVTCHPKHDNIFIFYSENNPVLLEVTDSVIYISSIPVKSSNILCLQQLEDEIVCLGNKTPLIKLIRGLSMTNTIPVHIIPSFSKPPTADFNGSPTFWMYPRPMNQSEYCVTRQANSCIVKSIDKSVAIVAFKVSSDGGRVKFFDKVLTNMTPDGYLFPLAKEQVGINYAYLISGGGLIQITPYCVPTKLLGLPEFTLDDRTWLNFPTKVEDFSDVSPKSYKSLKEAFYCAISLSMPNIHNPFTESETQRIIEKMYVDSSNSSSYRRMLLKSGRINRDLWRSTLSKTIPSKDMEEVYERDAFLLGAAPSQHIFSSSYSLTNAFGPMFDI